MDSSRDNLITRFTTFWWSLGTFLVFALLLGVIWIFVNKNPETMEDAAAQPRYVTKTKIDAAQEANISPEAKKAAALTVGKQLLASKPMAIEKPEQLVPGKPKKPGADDAPIDPAVLAIGKAQ